MHHTQEPPIPRPEHYERSWRASNPSRVRRAMRWVDWHPGWTVTGLVALMAAAPVVVIVHDNPALGAADHAAVVATPTAAPGAPSRKGPEYAPPLPDRISGDGMWIVGKQMKPGVYQSNAGASCYWERLAGLSGKYPDLLDNGGFRRGPKLVEVKATDFAFASQGCGTWVMVR